MAAYKVDRKKQTLMILKLRNRHRYTWIVLGLLLPAGFALGLACRPGPVLPNEELIREAPLYSEGQAVASAMDEDWNITLYRAPDGQAWLEAQFTKAAQRPVSTLYLAPQSGAVPARGKAIGPVGPRGIYRYPLDSLTASWPEYYLFFYDQVRHQAYSETQLTKSR